MFLCFSLPTDNVEKMLQILKASNYVIWPRRTFACHRLASCVTADEEGEEAELAHSFLIGNVKGCILSLGQLYYSGWSVKQHGNGPVLESPDQVPAQQLGDLSLRVPRGDGG